MRILSRLVFNPLARMTAIGGPKHYYISKGILTGCVYEEHDQSQARVLQGLNTAERWEKIADILEDSFKDLLDANYRHKAIYDALKTIAKHIRTASTERDYVEIPAKALKTLVNNKACLQAGERRLMERAARYYVTPGQAASVEILPVGREHLRSPGSLYTNCGAKLRDQAHCLEHFAEVSLPRLQGFTHPYISRRVLPDPDADFDQEWGMRF